MRHQKGFTLIELLLYIAISAIVLLALSVFFATLLNARVKNETMTEIDAQGAATMSLITQAIRNANEISSPVASTSDSSLSLNVDDVALSPTVFFIAGNALMMSDGAGDPVALMNGRVRVTDFQVKNLSRIGTKGNVRITFTLSRLNPAGRNEYNYSRTFEGSASLR